MLTNAAFIYLKQYYSKNSKIVKYYYNLKWFLFDCIFDYIKHTLMNKNINK